MFAVAAVHYLYPSDNFLLLNIIYSLIPEIFAVCLKSRGHGYVLVHIQFFFFKKNQNRDIGKAAIGIKLKWTEWSWCMIEGVTLFLLHQLSSSEESSLSGHRAVHFSSQGVFSTWPVSSRWQLIRPWHSLHIFLPDRGQSLGLSMSPWSQIVKPNASCSTSCLCCCWVTYPDLLVFSCRFFHIP